MGFDKTKVSIDFQKNEIQNVAFQNLSADPGTPAKGQVFYDTDDDRAKLNVGTPGAPNFLKLLVEGEGTSSIAGASDTNISGIADAQILVWDGVDSWDNKSMSGDATMTNAGVVTIQPDAVTYDKMQDTTSTLVVLGKTSAGAGTVEEVVIDTDISTVPGDNSQLASSDAIKTYVDSAVTGVDKYKGVIDCSTNPNYPAGVVGDRWVVSGAGKIGGASGENVEVGDQIICRVDNAGGTEVAVGGDWDTLQVNIDGAVTSAETVVVDGELPVWDGTSGKIIKDSGVAISSLMTKYTADFAVATWVGAGPYTLTITAGTHGLTADKYLGVRVYEDGTPNSEVNTGVTVSDTGEVVITSNSTFDGHYIIS